MKSDAAAKPALEMGDWLERRDWGNPIIAGPFEVKDGFAHPLVREALQKAKNNGLIGPFSFTGRRDPADASGVVVLEPLGGKFHIIGETS
jgi:hypothetical protein